MRTLFHTSHPGLAAALRRNKLWTQVSARLVGGDKVKSSIAITKSRERKGVQKNRGDSPGYGGHFRAVQGFRYLGEEL
jgi:hypothetical protein